MLWELQSFVARLRVCYEDACLVACQPCWVGFQAASSLAAAPFAAFVGGFAGIAVALGFRELAHQARFGFVALLIQDFGNLGVFLADALARFFGLGLEWVVWFTSIL